MLHQHPIPTGSWAIFKTYTVIRKNEEGGSQTHDKSQLSTIEPKLQLPKKGSDLRDQVSIPPAHLFLSSPDPTAGVHFTFSANDLQMYRSSGCLTTPTLKEKKKKEREGKRQVMTV